MEEGLGGFLFRCCLQRLHHPLVKALLNECWSYTEREKLTSTSKTCLEAAPCRSLIFAVDKTVVYRLFGQERSTRQRVGFVEGLERDLRGT
jgi:hypothetical protein